jgi:hypothetical protein
MFKFIFSQNRGEIRHSDVAPFLGIMWAVPRLPVLYPGIWLATEEHSAAETSVRAVDKCQLGPAI